MRGKIILIREMMRKRIQAASHARQIEIAAKKTVSKIKKSLSNNADIIQNGTQFTNRMCS